MTTEEKVRGFILENFYVSDPAELTDDASLIDTGIVDSMGMLDIILFLETGFGIAIEDRDATPQNLETIGRIAAFVERKLEAERVATGDRSSAHGPRPIDEPGR
jgi:acyl carrier protein